METEIREIPEQELKAEEEADLINRFRERLADGRIVEDMGKFIIARYTTNWREAAELSDRFDMAYQLDKIKQICFVNGMVDGVQTFMREIRKLGPLKAEKPIKIGNAILAFIAKERKKI